MFPDFSKPRVAYFTRVARVKYNFNPQPLQSSLDFVTQNFSANTFAFQNFGYLCIAMHVISHKTLVEFYENRFPDSETSLEEWYTIAKQAEWKNAAEVKSARPDVDYPGNGHYIFNICGNRYRLVVIILFQVQRIYIRFIGTHKEYDGIDCKTI